MNSVETPKNKPTSPPVAAYRLLLRKVLATAKTLQDVRAVGLVMFGAIVLLITWSGIKVIETNYGLQKDIARLQQENSVMSLRNKNAALKNEYYRTDQYLELQARQNFGLAAPGETVLIVPKRVALARTTDWQPARKSQAPDDNRSKYQKNFSAWIDFFRHQNRP